MKDPAAIRRHLKQARTELSHQQQQRASRAIIEKIGQHLRFRKAKRIGSYVATRGEVDLFKLQVKPEQKVYLPVLRESERPWQGRGLLFGQGTRLARNRYGIPEPQGTVRIEPGSLDYLLIPLVAFDREGHRLGMGGGYYDRALARLKPYRKTFKLGVAYSFQEVESVQTQPWDISLDGIVTESEMILL